MPYSTPPNDPASSLLKMERIVFDNISFIRSGFKSEQSNEELSLKINVSVSNGPESESVSRVRLRVSATKKHEYEASVSISGFCTVEGTHELTDNLLKKNAIAILFPYVRAELTLLTAQPETDPIVLPAININGLIDNMAQNGNQ